MARGGAPGGPLSDALGAVHALFLGGRARRRRSGSARAAPPGRSRWRLCPLLPATLIDEYRKTVRVTYLDFHGADSLQVPDAAEGQRFAETLELCDMGTHLCALPTGEHCSRGLVCLGCSSAQPKKSAAPIFRRMLTSHQGAPDRA